eukprot:1182688-Prorocentrum_minimum.AAC.2
MPGLTCPAAHDLVLVISFRSDRRARAEHVDEHRGKTRANEYARGARRTASDALAGARRSWSTVVNSGQYWSILVYRGRGEVVNGPRWTNIDQY